MNIYTENNTKLKCIKTNQPKFKSAKNYWDAFPVKIDYNTTKFYFTVRNNRGYFYFLFRGVWYKTNMITEDGMDLFYYIENGSKEFYTEINSHHIN